VKRSGSEGTISARLESDSCLICPVDVEAMRGGDPFARSLGKKELRGFSPPANYTD
jgi:hypothetical protein